MTTQHTEETELPDDYSPSGDEMHHGAPPGSPSTSSPPQNECSGYCFPKKLD